jgi:hypothetical protein
VFIVREPSWNPVHTVLILVGSQGHVGFKALVSNFLTAISEHLHPYLMQTFCTLAPNLIVVVFFLLPSEMKSFISHQHVRYLRYDQGY